MTSPAAISVVQMIQALRGCVQELNKDGDHGVALLAQQSIVALETLEQDLRTVWNEDKPFHQWPLICTDYEDEREAEIEAKLVEAQS